MNLGFGTAMYYGFVVGVHGAQNVAIFYVWFLFIASLFFFSDDFCEVLAKKNADKGVPKWIGYPVAWCIIGSLVWFGCIVTAIAYMLAWFFSLIGQHSINDLRKHDAALQKVDLSNRT